MTTNISEIKAEHDALKAQRELIDLDALTRQRDEAKAAAAAYQPPRGSYSTHSDERPLIQALGDAENILINMQSKARSLEKAIQPLQRMLSGQGRAAQAQADADMLKKRVANAHKAVEKAQGTVQTLQGLLADANATYALECDAAAKQMLTAAKAGRSGPATVTDRSKADTLESALTMARDELAEAETVHTAATQAHTAALSNLRVAQGDTARLSYELALRGFAMNVVEYRQLADADYLPGEDIEQRVLEIERAEAAY